MYAVAAVDVVVVVVVVVDMTCVWPLLCELLRVNPLCSITVCFCFSNNFLPMLILRPARDEHEANESGESMRSMCVGAVISAFIMLVKDLELLLLLLVVLADVALVVGIVSSSMYCIDEDMEAVC